MVLTTTHLGCIISLKYLPPIPVSVFLKCLLGYSCFTVFCQFLLYSRVNQLYTYVYSFFRFLFHLGHHRALSSFLAIQQVLIFLYVVVYIYVNPKFMPPTLLSISLFSVRFLSYTLDFFSQLSSGYFVRNNSNYSPLLVFFTYILSY